MPKSTQKEKSAFHRNLEALIGDSSVLAWTKARKLDQTTIQRILNGSDPKLTMIERIAKAVGRHPWELLAPGLVVEMKTDAVVQGLEQRLESLLAETKAARADMLHQAINSDASAPAETPTPAKVRKGGQK